MRFPVIGHAAQNCVAAARNIIGKPSENLVMRMDLLQ